MEFATYSASCERACNRIQSCHALFVLATRRNCGLGPDSEPPSTAQSRALKGEIALHAHIAFHSGCCVTTFATMASSISA